MINLNRPDDRKSGRSGSKRKLRLRLDPAQYYADMKVISQLLAVTVGGLLTDPPFAFPRRESSAMRA